MNVLVVGLATREQYFTNLIQHIDPESDLYVFEEFFNEELDAAAEQLQTRLFISDYFIKKGEKRPVDLICYFTNKSSLNEVLMLDEAVKDKTPIMYFPV
jgi:hypothetical protein